MLNVKQANPQKLAYVDNTLKDLHKYETNNAASTVSIKVTVIHLL